MSLKRILLVCTGNSCRSVMAQGLMQHMLQQAGLDAVTVESSGTFAIAGMTPTRETQRVLWEAGIDCSHHRARSLTPEMIAGADLILVMEQSHLPEVLHRAPDAKGKTHLLKTYGLAAGEPVTNPNIPDPIGKPMEVYEVCFMEIREAVERVVKSLGVASG